MNVGVCLYMYMYMYCTLLFVYNAIGNIIALRTSPYRGMESTLNFNFCSIKVGSTSPPYSHRYVHSSHPMPDTVKRSGVSRYLVVTE